MMEAVRTSETSVDNYFTRQYFPEDNSEHHTHRRENLKSHTDICSYLQRKLDDMLLWRYGRIRSTHHHNAPVLSVISSPR
jgi:hypothetical protein